LVVPEGDINLLRAPCVEGVALSQADAVDRLKELTDQLFVELTTPSM